MEIVVCCHLDATGVNALESEAAQMLFAVLDFCTDMVLTALMQHCMLLGEELSAQQSSSLCMCLELGYQVACWGIDFRKTKFSYVCKLQDIEE